MPITVKLTDGVEIYVENGDIDALREAFEAALLENRAMKIASDNGRVIIVNPQTILYIEGPSSRAAVANGNGASTSAATPAQAG